MTRCHIGPTRVGNALARWAQRRYAGAWSVNGEQDIITQHYDPALRMSVNPNHHIGGAIYWRGSYARRILNCVGQFLRPDMVFADIGANQGEVTVFAARRLMQGTAIAFEPTTENFHRLLANVQLNNLTNVVALDFCLGSETGEVELFAPGSCSHHHRYGWNEGMPSMYAPGPQATTVARVAVRRLDDVLPTLEVGGLDVVKVDVEGAELHVLRGGEDSIRRYRPVIVVEINSETYRAAGYEPFDVCAYLQSLGYDGFELNRAGNRGRRIGQSVSDQCDAVWLPR